MIVNIDCYECNTREFLRCERIEVIDKEELIEYMKSLCKDDVLVIAGVLDKKESVVMRRFNDGQLVIIGDD